MIQAIMLIALGFLVASLIGVLLAPSLWSRAARLTKKRLEGSLPLTLTEIEAAQDHLRAAHAVRLRRLESALAKAKQKAASQLVDNSRLQMQIIALKDQIEALGLQLAERRNAATVLEQTVTKRFPSLNQEILAAKAQLQERSYEVEGLTGKLARREEELAAAKQAAVNFQEELQRLHHVLERSAVDRSGRRVRRASQWDLDDYRAEYDRLNLELSKLRQQLALFQERDSQQTSVIKGELQRLAESILASAQTQSAPPELETPKPAQRRIAAPEARRERPAPWLPVTQPLAAPAGPKPAVSRSDLPHAKPSTMSEPSLVSSVEPEAPAPVPMLNNGHSEESSRPKILQEVGNGALAGDGLGELSLAPHGAPATPAPQAEDAVASSAQGNFGNADRKGPHDPVLTKAEPGAEPASGERANGGPHASPLNGEKEGASLSEAIASLETLDSKDEKIEPHLPTLLERLRAAGQEVAEGEKPSATQSL